MPTANPTSRFKVGAANDEGMAGALETPGSAVQIVQRLATSFAQRASRHDADDSFVAENFTALREAGFFKAAIPRELGGGGDGLPELCEAIRLLALSCSSTGLAASMHTHTLRTMVWRYERGAKDLEPVLRKIASEDLVLVTSGGSDWLHGSGEAKRVEGGFRVTGHKVFVSGSPSKGLLMTTAVHDDPKDGPTVLHFGVPMAAPEVRVHDNWRTLGMRGTGSNDLDLTDYFVPDAAIRARRPKGKFVPLIHAVAINALPIIYAAYLGIAQAARDRALQMAAGKRNDPLVQVSAGELETELYTAAFAHERMVQLALKATPDAAATAPLFAGRTIVGRAVCRVAERAMELAGGGAFFREAGLERLFRDIQASRYHPLQEKPQAQFCGRIAFGLAPDG